MTEGKAQTSQQKHERKQSVQTHGRASVTRSITKAVVIKDSDMFFLCEPDGGVPLEENHGFGLYYHDCRYLDGYEVKLAGRAPESLASTAVRGFMGVIETTNPDLEIDEKTIAKESLGIKWERIIDSANTRLCEVMTIRNYSAERVELPLSFTFRAQFDPLFAVRGLLKKRPGKLHSPRWDGDTLCFVYDGADGIRRSLSITCAPTPSNKDKDTANFHIALAPEETAQIQLSLRIEESSEDGEPQVRPDQQADIDNIRRLLKRTASNARSNQAQVDSDNESLNRVLLRSLGDLHILKMQLEGKSFFAAGVPWFVTLFGRDSIISAMQMLAFDVGMAEETLRLLASKQGNNVDDWRDEQPGKILHELRVGELAHLNEIPETPYYGSVDATPLFLMLIVEHARWTGRLSLFSELRENVEAALKWMSHYGDANGDGYIEYNSASQGGLINQGWKDSGNAIVNADVL